MRIPSHCGPEKNIHLDIPIAQSTGKIAKAIKPTPVITRVVLMECDRAQHQWRVGNDAGDETDAQSARPLHLPRWPF
jgi:hypothetical protein